MTQLEIDFVIFQSGQKYKKHKSTKLLRKSLEKLERCIFKNLMITANAKTGKVGLQKMIWTRRVIESYP